MSFDWQTEDDVSWGQPERPSPSPPPRPCRRWQWVVLVVALLGGTAVYTLYRELSQRVETVSDTVEADLLASYDIVQQAIRLQDRELLAVFMSGRDPSWVDFVDQRVKDGRYYDRTPLALDWVQTDTAPSPAITLSHDLRAAELVTSHQYAIQIGNGLTETVTLAETAVYRLGPNRWLLSPPDQSFWGDEERVQGQLITITYPERDSEIVKRLALDVDTKLIELCAHFPDLSCPENLHVQLHLVPEARFLPEDMAAVLYSASAGDLRLSPFPTPSALGVPVDEAGYQAMYRGYASQVVTAVIDALLDVNCCREKVLYHAIRARYLQELSLQPWPVTAKHYQQGINTPLAWDDLDAVWQMEMTNSDLDTSWSAYALVAYLVDNRPSAAKIDLLRLFNRHADDTFSEWLQAVLANSPDEGQYTQSWRRFVYQHSQMAQQPLPIPLPDQDLYMLCQTSERANLGLYRYQFERDSYTLIDRLPTLNGFLLALSDDSGTAVGERILNTNPASIYIWANGVKTTLSWTGSQFEMPGAAPITFDTTGTKLLVSGAGSFVGSFGLINIADCLGDGSCNVTTADGFPIWSPSGVYSIVGLNYQRLDELQTTTLLYVGDANGQVPDITLENKPIGWIVGSGYAPFWLDDSRFAYIYSDLQSGISTLALVDRVDLEEKAVLTAVDLLNTAPADGRPDWSTIHYAAINPQNRDEQLLVTAGTLVQSAPGHVFVYNMVTEAISHRFELLTEPQEVQRGYRFSPDGRYLLITSLLQDSEGWVLYVHDIAANTTQTYPLGEDYLLPAHLYLDWSADGRWLSTVQDGFVRLIAPEVQVERRLIPEVLSCSASVWVNK